MKRIISSVAMLVFVTALVAGGTGAFFNDTETSSGNVFVAGAIDLTIDHTAASYNGESCTELCEPVGQDLIENGDFELPELNNGTWAIYQSITGWETESGAGIEVQNNADGAPHGGEQLVELDSTQSSAMIQVITTVPGERYRLTFWHSPRPNRPDNDNAIDYEVQVVSGPSTIINGQVGTAQAGGGSTSWTEYSYDFVAVDANTKVIFSDASPSNSYGGYLDDVSVFAVECDEQPYQDTPGGYCDLWTEKDLEDEKFFDFSDVKPQDEGTNLISLHVENNPAYLCLNVTNKEDKENTNIEPEQSDGDLSVPEGELGNHLMVMGWYSDQNGNELAPLFGPAYAEDLSSITVADSASLHAAIAAGTTEYIKLKWCLGTLSPSGQCDGDVPNINQTQTDSFLADLQFFAEQTRNNDEFLCEEPKPEV